jgi:septum formation protein
MNLPHPLILASASRGRAELLLAAGYDFIQDPTGIPEPAPAPGEDPAAHARRLARLKAEAAVRRHPGALVLAADTIAFCGDRILGKPRDEEDAVAMLAYLAGRPHTLVSALCVAFMPPGGAPRFEAGEDRAEVTLRPWSHARLRRHVERVKPLFCAGAYALQEGGLSIVEKLEGDPSTVVGLPLDLLDRLLARMKGPS